MHDLTRYFDVETFKTFEQFALNLLVWAQLLPKY